MIKNPALHGRIKNINTKIHFIRDLVAVNISNLQFCSTVNQIVDGLTKSLYRGKFLQFRA